MAVKDYVDLYTTQISETVRYYSREHIVVMVGGHTKAINCHGWISRP